MFTSRHLVEWLEEFTPGDAEVYNDRIPPTGRIIYVRMGSGPGYGLEGTQDTLVCTIECRGADRNYDDAELLARTVDDVILKNGTTPYEFDDGTYMYVIARTGGPPVEVLVADTAGRYAFTCNYYITVATDL